MLAKLRRELAAWVLDHLGEALSTEVVRAADDSKEELQSLGPQRLSAVEAARASIMKVVTDLADSDAIALGRPTTS